MLTDDSENDLARHVVEACQNAIARAIAQPSQAIGLAQGLEAALTSLQLVQREVAKGDKGAGAVTANADTLTRQALTDVLWLSSQPEAAFEALAAVGHVAPKVAEPAERPKMKADRVLPLFSEISQAYIDMRIERDGENRAFASGI